MLLDKFTFRLGREVDERVFGAFDMNKCQWGWVLEIDERTIRNWEHEVINKCDGLANLYHFKMIKEGVKPKTPLLDGYRRFLIYIILNLKNGGYDGRRRKNKEVIEFLTENKDELKRTQFIEWMKNNEKCRPY